MSTAFRRFRIAARVPECSIITSFYLVPTDNQPMWAASPGQYLTLRIPTGEEYVLKTYSISSDVDDSKGARISVKRESAPAHSPDVPDGIGSCWLHDHAQVGTEIDIAAPRGDFVLNQNSNRPVVLLSGGVGLTPLLSMLYALSKTDRPTFYVHGCENGDMHAMFDEVNSLIANSGQRIQQHVAYRIPLDSDVPTEQYHSTGLIDKSVLQSLLPIDNYEWYLCGPTVFMIAQYRLLLELGVNEDDISYEFFGKALSLQALAAKEDDSSLYVERSSLIDSSTVVAPKTSTQFSSKKSAGENAPVALTNLVNLTNPDAWAIDKASSTGNDATSDSQLAKIKNADSQNQTDRVIDVVFSKSAISTKWSKSNESLLELAEQAGLSPEFSCRSGICSSCKCRISEGDVEYFEQPLQMPEPGFVLICCSRPTGRVVLDL